MGYVELVDFHRKGISMTQQSGDSSREKVGGFWEEYPVNQRNRWLFGILTLACFLTFQTLLAVGPQDIALTVSLWAFALVLPMNVLLVLLTYASKQMPGKVRFFCLSCPAVVGTIIGIDAAFWHVSWVGGVVFTVASVIELPVALNYLRPQDKANEKEVSG
jgi:hypothetical protein